MTRKRKVVTVIASLAGLVLLAIGAAVLVLESSWFYEKVRSGIVTTVSDATGGRVSIGAFHLDWKRMRVELTSLQVAGKEPAGKPALFRADSIAIGFKIVSLLKHDVDVQSLEVRNPRVYLILYPDGGTNLPAPKVKRAGGNTMETILKLAVQRFDVQNGIFEIESQGKTPFDARGQNLNAALQFEPAGPRYRGDISVQQLEVGGADYHGVWSAAATVAFEKDRVAITSARLSTGTSTVQVAGTLENLAAPHAQFRFDARVAAADAGRALRIKLLERGTVEVAGTAQWTGGAQYSLNGKLHAYNLDYGGAYVQLRGFRADGDVSAAEAGIRLSAVRLSGSVAHIAVAGGVDHISFRAGDLGFQGIGLAALGGTFHGEARVREFDRFNVTGEIAGVEARRAVSLYSSQALPWNSRVTGKVSLEGLLQRKNELRANADLLLEPAPDSAPVHGRISASYDTRTATLDLGHADVTLPSSRAELSGTLGQQMRVHLETHDFDDLLPLLGQRAATLPVKLENGSAVFDGTVTGKLDDPQAAGHLTARSLLFNGEKIDSLAADVTLSARNAAVRNATMAHGSLSAQLEAAVQLHDWKADGSSLIAGSGSIRNASLADMAAVIKLKQTPVTGTLAATAQVNGTVGGPIVKGDVIASKGALLDEPFDQLTAHVEASGRTVAVTNAQLNAGAKQAKFSATYDHAPDALATGRLRFEIQSNSMPLEAIETVRRERPDVKGVVRISASGAVDLVAPKAGEPGIRVSDLHGDLTASGLRVAQQALGDAHLTANTQGQTLRAHVDSDFAGSSIKGDGEWKLEGDYPGSATLAFSRIDLAQLRAWLTPQASGISESFAGWAEGQFRLDGPALKPGAIKVELRIPNFELGAAPGGTAAAASLTLRNSGPIVASMSNSVISVDSMRLVGHDSDLGVSGKISLQQKTSDLRVNGHVDLAIVHDLNRDFRATGTVTADATVRGSLMAPTISGRTEFHNAAFQVADLPNGLSGTNGVIVFSGDRATIQSFSGDTGGGKVELSGFAGYGGGQTIFRMHARVQAVRVRYPEGVSTVADASLNLTGTPDRSMLAGTVTVLRTGFNPQSDFSSLISQSAQPVETPSARAGFLGGLSFDIQINTAPDIEFQSSLAQDLEVEANLRLRGTFSNPALLGRINLTEGQIIFFGTRYNITQGSISFFNPIRVEPIFDVNLETKARGIDITLAVTGPLNKLNLTPLSDPPLQLDEIVALLATGRTPTNDPAMLSQQATGAAVLATDGGFGVAGSGHCQPGGRPAPALLRRQPVAHRCLPCRVWRTLPRRASRWSSR